jgi:DNA invertase Pin-like site-specific DNA recombinase
MTSRPKEVIMRRAFSYIRFSTPEQLKGDSLRRQTALTTEYCKRNKLHLDDSLNLRDLGVSAFRGGNAETGALSGFLDAVKSDRVPGGSVLIVENLDRLTRDEIGEALSLFISILKSGVHIVTLRPEVEYTRKSINEIGVILQAVLQLFLGHEESAKKSERLTEVWDAKRATLGKRKLTGKCPFWLRLSEEGSRFVIDEDRAAVVRRMFALAKAGQGSAAIAKQLNHDGIPSPYGRSWSNVSVLAILRSRAVFGEFTPHAGRYKTRKAIGAPIPNYYPPILTETEFYAVQAGIAGRKLQRGPRGKHTRNLFTGLLHDARDGTAIHLSEKRKGDVRMVSHGAMRGKAGAKYVSFPYPVFERAILDCLAEIDAREILDEPEEESEASALKNELARVRGRKAEVEAELRHGDLAALARLLRQLTDEERELIEKQKAAQEKDAAPIGEAWGEVKNLRQALERAPDQEKARLRGRAVLGRAVETIQCLFVARGWDRIAAVQIWLAGGEKHRDYLILHRPPKANARARVEGGWWCRSLATIHDDDDLDLRNPQHAKELEEALAAADIASASDETIE